ncbi:malate/lactate/ureidoglycolate dehydrogenase [Kosakonia sacchari]|uniref:malate/lactate/ureidoglycolate dehydrogenase n=1 Tax=Kosakonia sacchari TaxID=1158459 RepID=UPI002ACD7F30|nr:malate/lactate/ureidoglycolate dehydrogenase [Kosakonia sacchari]MDZ7324568.1 malate/lactate/ureidoglycolate dehydrogenase [Kosakonia sacchari]
MPLFSHQQLRALLQQHLLRVNTAPEIAQKVADNLVEASLKGHDSHGVTLLPRYIRAILAGDLNANASLQTVREEGAILSFDGNHGFGQLLGEQAMAAGIARAEQSGVAIVGLANSHHLGRIGAWAEQVAAAGLVSIHFANVAAPSAVLPFNGRHARLGTNPFCVGVPLPGRPPVVLDFATSAIAGNKARIAWNEGRSIPEGCAVDAHGQPTTDPGVLMTEPRGALLPFGGHKGAGLSLICSLLGAALTGGETESHQIPPRAGIINNMLSILFDPQKLGAGEQYQYALLAQIDYLCEGQEDRDVQIPGEPERRAYTRRQQAGIYIDDVSWREFLELEALNQ